MNQADVKVSFYLKKSEADAKADGILTFNPFRGYEPERPQREQKYLTAEELELIMTTPLHL